MRRAMAKRWGIWVLALAAGLVRAEAAMLTYSVVVNNGGAYYESGSGGTFNLTQFDSSLGTLQGAVLTITASSLEEAESVVALLEEEAAPPPTPEPTAEPTATPAPTASIGAAPAPGAPTGDGA